LGFLPDDVANAAVGMLTLSVASSCLLRPFVPPIIKSKIRKIHDETQKFTEDFFNSFQVRFKMKEMELINTVYKQASCECRLDDLRKLIKL